MTAVHQIEITSRCNLACVYCLSPQIMKATAAYAHQAEAWTNLSGLAGHLIGTPPEPPPRPAMDMSRAVYVRALELVTSYVKAGTQVELNLAGIGESTLHPAFIDYLRLAREAVGEYTRIIFATNGLIASDDFVRAMVPYRPEVWVSLHRPEKAARALDTYKKYHLARGVSTDPATFPNDWAGQIDWPVAQVARTIPCQWLREGKVFVLADGRIATCCLDARASGIRGHVNDPIGSTRTQPYALCATCYQEIGATGYTQCPRTSPPTALPVIP